ncbi:MAG TPA: ThiF family adenylyltransferase [Candidatus Saccharimonadales bacterium]|nr:ThiF family adenylyltransferase [Candidatus Saccharimonadales bacterium]
MRTLDSPELYRNMGFWDNATQQALLETTVAIGGAGGAGYLVGLELARIGVQSFDIADPEDFDDVNSNRVLGVNVKTIGRNKAEVFQEDIFAINPDAKVHIYKDGVTTDNLEEFMHRADIVLDATELSMPELGTMIAREARRREVPVVNVEYVGHAGQGTSFDPHSKMTFERFMGIKGGVDAPLDEVADQSINPNRYLAYLPPYADINTLIAIQEKEGQKAAPLPSNMIGAGQAAQIAVSEMVKHVRQGANLKGLAPVFAPSVRWMDAYTGKSGITHHPRISYYRRLATMVAKNALKLNEKASYSVEERAARGDLG